jgi:hypothetical protein
MTLALRCAGGLAVMIASMFAMMLLPARLLRPSGAAPCSDSGCSALLSPILLTWLALLIGGAVTAARAEGRIKRGIRDGTWQEEELNPLRVWIDRPSIKMITLLPLLGWVGYLVDDHRLSLVGMLPLFLHPALMPSRIDAMLRPVVPRGPAQDWHTWKPLQSGYWASGARRANAPATDESEHAL